MCDNTSEGNSTTGWQSEAEPTSKTMAVNSYAFSINASTTTLLSIPWDNKGKTNKPLPVRKYFFFYFRKESFLCSYSNCPSFKRKDTSRISSVAFLIESFTPKATLTPMLDPELAGFTCNKMKWSKREIKKKKENEHFLQAGRKNCRMLTTTFPTSRSSWLSVNHCAISLSSTSVPWVNFLC